MKLSVRLLGRHSPAIRGKFRRFAVGGIGPLYGLFNIVNGLKSANKTPLPLGFFPFKGMSGSLVVGFQAGSAEVSERLLCSSSECFDLVLALARYGSPFWIERNTFRSAKDEAPRG